MARILIVDGDPGSRDLLTTILGYGENNLIVAQNGEEAVRLTETERPDLIITDILMPKMDGFSLVRRLSADPLLRKVPVIFQTANYREEEVCVLAQACGVQHILFKPIEPEALLKTVQSALGQKTTLKELPQTGELQRRHLQLLADKLHQKVAELEASNIELDERIREKTRELEAVNAGLRNLSVTDELTGLNNRRGFKLLAEELLKLFRRSGHGKHQFHPHH